MATTQSILAIAILGLVGIPNIAGGPISELISNDVYADAPTEVFPIKPLLIYPRPRDLKLYKSPTSEDQRKMSKVIYVQLLKVNYRPKNFKSLEDFDINSSHAGPKDIFYVKALVNGKFSDQRLMLYRIPEFYAINVYKKTG